MTLRIRGPTRKKPKKMTGKKNTKGSDPSREPLAAVAVAKKKPTKTMKTSRNTSIGRKKPRSRCGFPSQSIRSPGGISKLIRRSVRRFALAPLRGRRR